MKITIFTSNQPRHIYFIKQLSSIADRVYAVVECKSFRRNETMQKYFRYVDKAEKEAFGEISFISSKIDILPLRSKNLSELDMNILKPALDSDIYIVFGASYIKGNLCDFLIKNKAINLHMGISPYYRGSASNFWALYQKRIDMVGATIHFLDKGLDSGDIIYHALPKAQKVDSFKLGMLAVKAALDSLLEKIKSNEVKNFIGIPQDKAKELKYAKSSDFTDEIAQDYLHNIASTQDIYDALLDRDKSLFINPIEL